MDPDPAAPVKQMIWELVSPLFDRLDQVQHEVRDLRARVQACEAELNRLRPPAMLPPPESGGHSS